MSTRELRLRQRIDLLTDERDIYKDAVHELTALVTVLEERLACALASWPHSNQHGRCVVYGTEADRVQARRLSWRMSKRRRRDREAVT